MKAHPEGSSLALPPRLTIGKDQSQREKEIALASRIGALTEGKNALKVGSFGPEQLGWFLGPPSPYSFFRATRKGVAGFPFGSTELVEKQGLFSSIYIYIHTSSVSDFKEKTLPNKLGPTTDMIQ